MLGLYLAGAHWLYRVPKYLFDFPDWKSHLLNLFVLSCLAISYGFLSLIVRISAKTFSSRSIYIVVFPFIWTLAEWIRGPGLYGLPWFFLGFTQADGPLSGFLPLVGVYGTSWVATCISALIFIQYRLLRESIRDFRPTMGIACLILFGLIGNDIEWTTDKPESSRIVLVQPAKQLSDELDTSSSWLTLKDTTLRLWQNHDLVVWPESSIDLYYGSFKETNQSFLLL